MKKVFWLLSIGIAFCAAVIAGDEHTYEFGRDKLALRTTFILPSQDELERSKRVSQDASLIYMDLQGLPLRKDVRLYRETHDRVLTATDGHSHIAITSDNLGYFARSIEDGVECRALILLLHSPKNLLAASSFDNVLQKIGESKDLPFKILDKDIDERQVGEGCVKKDGYWQWNFLIREDASVCEYKYVIDKENHVTQFRRVLIEGPQAIPQFGGNAGSETMSTKAQEHYASFCKCVDFLIAAARKQDK